MAVLAEEKIVVRREYQRQHYAKNKDKITERRKLWRASNVEKIREYVKAYREKHGSSIGLNQKRYVYSEKGLATIQKNKLSQDRYRRANPGVFREKAWKYAGINLSVEGYNQMFLGQEGRCAICERHQSDCKKALAVDHCHTTGKVRGLLCNSCNAGLGFLKDDAGLIKRVLDYLGR
jgi:hypothetical protein